MKFFLHSPQDDLALRREAREVAARFSGVLPNAAALSAVSAAQGVDFATAVLHEAVLMHSGHGAFVRALDAINPRIAAVRARHTLLVVPGLVWEDHPELGADGALMMQVGRRLGFDVRRVQTRGRAALTENAERIVVALNALDAESVWIVSLSKGSADLGCALRRHAQSVPWARLAGWINVCGTPNGSDLATLMLSSVWRKARARATCWMSRIPFQALREMAADHPGWAQPIALPEGFQVVNVVGMPLRWHLQVRSVARHAMLSPSGPNDGIVLCANAAVSSGMIYPLWGYDHYFRGPETVPLLYRLLTWCRNQQIEGRQARRHSEYREVGVGA